MPTSDFNSATPNSAYWWVRTGAGANTWDYYTTRGYDFLRALETLIGPARVPGTWTPTEAEHLAIWLANTGPEGALLAAAIRSDPQAGTRVGKAELIGAVWALLNGNYNQASAGANAALWPNHLDVIIPVDAIGPPMGTAPPHSHSIPRDQQFTRHPAGTGAPLPPAWAITPEQAAPITPVSAPIDPTTGASIPGLTPGASQGDYSSVLGDLGHAASTLMSTSGATPIIQMSTPQGVRPMPVVAPNIVAAPNPIPWVPIAIGATAFLALTTVVIVVATRKPAMGAQSQPPSQPRQLRVSAGGTYY